MSKQKQRLGKVHAIIPDVQIRPGVPTEHLRWVGNYIADKRPDTIIQIGDFADMTSLNSYNVGKASSEGQRYDADIQAVKEAMKVLLKPIRKVKGYHPRMVLTLGNHEDRITREANANPKFKNVFSVKDLGYEEAGWEVHPFLKVVKIDGIEYVHYFTSGIMGRPVSSAASILRERHNSGVMGHVQHTDVAFHKKSGHVAIQAGICYLHDEEYLTPQGNDTRRQIIFLHQVVDGRCDPMFVSLDFLKMRYS